MKRTLDDEIIMLQYLGKLYRKYTSKRHDIVEEIRDKEALYESDEFLIDMHRILKELPEAYAEIIQNDFLMDNAWDWWQNKYDEITYTELKNMAVKAFFDCLYV